MRTPCKIALAICLYPTFGSAQAPMDDDMWLRSADRVHRVDRFGNVTTPPIRGAWTALSRAPDGSVWLIDSSSVLIVDRTGGNANRIPIAEGPVDIVHDARGSAWVVGSRTRELLQLGPSGSIQRRFQLPGQPTALTIVNDQIWVGQSNNPDPFVSWVDLPSGTLSTITVPTGSTAIIDICGQHRLIGPDHIWLTSGNRLVELDARGSVLRSKSIGSVASVRALPDGRILAGGFAYDPSNDELTLVFGDLLIDAIGDVWSGSSRQFSKLDRDLRPDSAFSLARLGNLRDDASGFERALTIAPRLDDDGDGNSNVTEALRGWNPYDDQSNAAIHLESTELNYSPGETVTFDVEGIVGQGVLLLGTGFDPAGTSIGGVIGESRLTGTFPVGIPVSVPGRVEIPTTMNTTSSGPVCAQVLIFDGARWRFSNHTCITLNADQVRVSTETFTNNLQLDPTVSSGTWANGSAIPGQIGGDGRLGEFDVTIGRRIGPDSYEWNTDDMTIPGRLTRSGQPERITNGVFEFSRFFLPLNTTLKIVGSRPAVFLSTSTVQILGTIDASGQRVDGGFVFKNTSSVDRVIEGQPGAIGGPGGGRGGNGAWSCDGSGNPSNAMFNDFNGYDGEDVQVPAGHAYANRTGRTGGRGGQLFPPHGDSNQVVFRALAGTYAVEAGAGGGGGGFDTAGAGGVVINAGSVAGEPPNTNRNEMGPPSPGGIVFNLFPRPSGTDSLTHFAVGGSGGGGSGSHPLFANRSLFADPNRFRAGAGGAGGGGALVFRTGGRITTSAGSILNLRGGSGDPPASPITINSNGAAPPGGSGSGGSILLQAEGGASLAGAIDVRGGDSIPLASAGFFRVDLRGGAGAPGAMRLEIPGGGSVSRLGSTQPAASARNVGNLDDRDVTAFARSRDYALGLTLPSEPLYYEVDATVDGVAITYSDRESNYRPANIPGQPVRIEFQGRSAFSSGPWRDFVGSPFGQAGIREDRPTRYRFRVTFDRTFGADIQLDSVRVYYR